MHPTDKSPSEMAYCIVGKRRRNLKRSLEKAKQSKKKSLGWSVGGNSQPIPTVTH